MTPAVRLRDIAREAVAAVVAQRVFATVTLLVVAGSTFVILATAGRSAAAQEAVLGQIDAQGTRTVLVQAKGDQPGLTTQTVDQFLRLDSVETAVGLGPVSDATAAALPQGTRVGVRLGYGRVGGQQLLQPMQPIGPRVAWASAASSRALGLPTGGGAVRLIDGPELFIARTLHVPVFLTSFEPLTLVPADRGALDEPIPVATIVVLAKTPQQVDAVTNAGRSLLADIPADGVTIETSSAMAQLRDAVGGELTRQGRGIVLGLLGAAAAATFVNVWGMVLMRRKDFGRRRALGASRLTIVVLIVTQVLVVAAVGALVGAAAGNAWLVGGGGQQPSLRYTTAVAMSLVSAAAAAAALPAWFAAHRDPIRELRVP